MIRGIYSSGLGMNVQSARLDTVSNNLANINTPGFKRESVLVESFPRLIQLSTAKSGVLPGVPGRAILGRTNAGAAVKQVVTDYSPGTLRETGNPFDVAIKGPGYFVLAGPENEDHLYYTRNGSFHVDEQGYLVNGHGYRVMGEDGPVRLENTENFSINGSGNVIENGTVTGVIYIVDFADHENLQRAGQDMFTASGGEAQQVEQPALAQRFLEGANVDPVEETVNMITASRAYETGQKIIQAQDSMLDLSINRVGRLR